VHHLRCGVEIGNLRNIRKINYSDPFDCPFDFRLAHNIVYWVRIRTSHKRFLA